MRRLLFVVIASLFFVVPARAQVCAGGASYANPYQAGAGISTASDVKISSIGGGLGGPVWFGQAGLQFTSFSGAGTAKGFFVTLGGDFVTDQDKKLHLCPLFDVSRSGSAVSVPNVDSSSTQFSFGGSAGYTLTKLDAASVVPTLGFFVHRASFSTKVAGVPVTGDTGETYETIQLGVGFVFNDKIALVPSIILPFGVDGGENSFALAFSYNFGR